MTWIQDGAQSKTSAYFIIILLKASSLLISCLTLLIKWYKSSQISHKNSERKIRCFILYLTPNLHNTVLLLTFHTYLLHIIIILRIFPRCMYPIFQILSSTSYSYFTILLYYKGMALQAAVWKTVYFREKNRNCKMHFWSTGISISCCLHYKNVLKNKGGLHKWRQFIFWPFWPPCLFSVLLYYLI